MRSLAVTFTAIVSVALIGCDQEKDAAAMPSKHRALLPSELSADDLAELTNSFYEKAMEDNSIMDSAEYREIDAAHGPVFKKQLITAIQKSESITIEEHSDQVDFLMLNWPYSDKLPRYVYRTVTLNTAQKTAFLEAVVSMEGKTIGTTLRCFEPHHRMDFIQQDGHRSSMSISFQCERVLWTDAYLDPPEALFGVLEGVVNGAGLQSERDWCALAKQRSEQEGTGQSATRSESKSEGSDKPQPEAEGRSR
jgi:hypothetical protein